MHGTLNRRSSGGAAPATADFLAHTWRTGARALIAPFEGRRSTVEELQTLAEIIELLYHEAGYFLARVTIPPQEVNDGGPFHLLVLDGHFGSVGTDLRGLTGPVSWSLEYARGHDEFFFDSRIVAGLEVSF